MLMYGSQLVAHAETFEELGENDKALNEKLVAHAKELEELKEKNEKLEDNIEEKKKLIEEKKKLIEEKIRRRGRHSTRSRSSRLSSLASCVRTS